MEVRQLNPAQTGAFASVLPLELPAPSYGELMLLGAYEDGAVLGALVAEVGEIEMDIHTVTGVSVAGKPFAVECHLIETLMEHIQATSIEQVRYIAQLDTTSCATHDGMMLNLGFLPCSGSVLTMETTLAAMMETPGARALARRRPSPRVCGIEALSPQQLANYRRRHRSDPLPHGFNLDYSVFYVKDGDVIGVLLMRTSQGEVHLSWLANDGVVLTGLVVLLSEGVRLIQDLPLVTKVTLAATDKRIQSLARKLSFVERPSVSRIYTYYKPEGEGQP